MKFSLSIDLTRSNPSIDMREVARNTMDIVQMADQGGFEMVWAAEHHAIEMTIAPNPFQLLAWFGGNTDNIRLGVAVVQAPYWHPIKVAGEAGLLDLMSGGRLELGLGRGAYQREFDRMAGGMDQHKGVAYMQEMLPVLKALWAGDCEHNGAYWQFPASTACPKPLQTPHPPLWVAARHPSTCDWALREGCNIMSWALTRPFSEVEKYKQQFEEALERAPGVKRPRFLTMRHAAVYADAGEGWKPFVDAMKLSGLQFESLFRELGEIRNGFAETPDPATLENNGEYDPEMLKANLVFGTPDQVIDKLRRYEALGVDNFLYRCCTGLPVEHQKESLRLFINEVMPAFEDSRYTAQAAE
ncbi:MAG: LLM class flavin-dependent oxidoreductase [Rhodospirillales bacterium]|nr:LLM class flavin-dependent oxidoreductase [Rhodospirillales bacterium]